VLGEFCPVDDVRIPGGKSWSNEATVSIAHPVVDVDDWSAFVTTFRAMSRERLRRDVRRRHDDRATYVGDVASRHIRRRLATASNRCRSAELDRAARDYTHFPSRVVALVEMRAGSLRTRVSGVREVCAGADLTGEADLHTGL